MNGPSHLTVTIALLAVLRSLKDRPIWIGARVVLSFHSNEAEAE